MSDDLQERVSMIILRNALRSRLRLTRCEHSLHLNAIESLQERIARRTLEIRRLTQENNDLHSRLDSADDPPPSPGIHRALQNYAFGATLPPEAEEPAFEARIPPSPIEAYMERFRRFEADIERRSQDLEAREAAHDDCRRKVEECEAAIRAAQDEIAEHQPVLQQLREVEREIDRLTEFCHQKAECEATYAELQAAFRDAQEQRGRGQGRKPRLDQNLAREYFDAVAERDRISISQADWTQRLSRLVAKLPAFAPA
jgi:chromosome segregation ATPase